MLTLFELFDAILFLIWYGNGVPTPFFNTTLLGFFQLHVHSVIPCRRPLQTESTPEGLKLGGFTFVQRGLTF